MQPFLLADETDESFLLAVELLCLQLCFETFLLTIEVFFLLTIEVLSINGQSASKHLKGLYAKQLSCKQKTQTVRRKTSPLRGRKISPKFSCIKLFQIGDVPTQIPGHPGHSVSKTTEKGHLHQVFVRDILCGHQDNPKTNYRSYYSYPPEQTAEKGFSCRNFEFSFRNMIIPAERCLFLQKTLSKKLPFSRAHCRKPQEIAEQGFRAQVSRLLAVFLWLSSNPPRTYQL